MIGAFSKEEVRKSRKLVAEAKKRLKELKLLLCKEQSVQKKQKTKPVLTKCMISAT
jgi:hypothetical protein